MVDLERSPLRRSTLALKSSRSLFIFSGLRGQNAAPPSPPSDSEAEPGEAIEGEEEEEEEAEEEEEVEASEGDSRPRTRERSKRAAEAGAGGPRPPTDDLPAAALGRPAKQKAGGKVGG